MTPTVQLYWLRVVLGIIAGALTAVLAAFGVIGNEADISVLFNCISIALIVYFLSYYVLKAAYRNKIAKQSKILSTGIGMYFFAWIAFLVLFYTIIKVTTGTAV
jgi:ABC-type uncharacterized transport system permease subunit